MSETDKNSVPCMEFGKGEIGLGLFEFPGFCGMGLTYIGPGQTKHTLCPRYQIADKKQKE